MLFSSERAAHLAETPLSDKQTLTPQSDGKVLLEASVTDTMDLRWWLHSFADSVEVIEPAEMRESFRDMAKRTAKLYN